ncbi:hypothetical protein O7626_24435 [Micromonospora sp. WMMD1102]|uniref:hypothetical protein n=1 Tax=Micromonospora sp. WMMD1102 TaxID=3016105 RepID=UPI0024151379|nr:hypothetical protein [Micromonospora sp. WMMD1102]MDG4789039.1 hypothetical protein [Micromonospora sp. WMMD1102]
MTEIAARTPEQPPDKTSAADTADTAAAVTADAADAAVTDADAAAVTDDTAAGSDPTSAAERIDLLQWHLDRYDRSRASTSSRASVVLSASAILSAGNAVVLAQLLGGSAADRLGPVPLVLFTLASLVSAGLVVLSLLRAASVLVTIRPSRAILGSGAELPEALVFNGTDTVRRLHSFAEFQAALAGQRDPEIRQAAQVELWIGIQQHRQRYVRLREAVRLLRYAAVAFLFILAGAMIGNLFLQL